MPSILVLAAHPQLAHSQVTRRLMDEAAAMPQNQVQLRDLYALYPDYVIDVAAEQAALEAAALVVWLYPTHWYGMPPLMKLWLDEVLGFGWAYGPGGTRLKGKHLWLATSTGGAEESYRSSGYNRYSFEAFLPPYEQTAALCGMRFLPPLVLHGAHRVSAEGLAAHAERFARRLTQWPDWPEMAEPAAAQAGAVPADARPEQEN